MGRLFNKKFDCSGCTEDAEVEYFNIDFNVHKIDSCTYSIVAKGAGVRPQRDVEEAFLSKAGQYLTSFVYYSESEKYTYVATSGYMTTSHTGFMVRGIITGSDNNTRSTERLNEKPAVFIREFKE